MFFITRFHQSIKIFVWLLFAIVSLAGHHASGQNAKPQILEEGYIFDQAEFKSCHASTVVQLANGKIMAAWFGGTEEGSPDVCIWMSVKENTGWTKPARIAEGFQPDGKPSPCWNPVLFQNKNGKLYLHYKVGPNPREWWAMYKVSADHGKTWSKPTPLPHGMLGPIKNKPVQLSDGNILHPSSTESIDEKKWIIHLEQSDPALTHWKKITLDCDTFNAIQPSLLFYPGHKMQLLARSKENVIVQSWSDDDGKTWSRVTTTNLPNPNSGIDAVSKPDRALQLLVYNPLTTGKEWWEGRSVLKLAASKDGVQWTDLYTLEEHQKGEYSYPAIIYDDQGNIHITYTADRSKIRYVKLKL
jgi:alpha-L-fucosidase